MPTFEPIDVTDKKAAEIALELTKLVLPYSGIPLGRDNIEAVLEVYEKAFRVVAKLQDEVGAEE